MTNSVEAQGLSVILPAYMQNPPLRQVLALRQSLESVLEQRFDGPREIVLIDDGSDPPIETFSTVLGPAYRGVRLMRHRGNQGVAAALNTGLCEARYELFARIDADDYWLPGKLETQLTLFQDADVTLTATGMIRVGPEGKEIDQPERPDNWRDILNFLCETGCPFPHASVIGRRSVLSGLGGYPRDARFLHCEDLALWGLWLRFFKPAAVTRPLLVHTVSERAISAIHRESQLSGTRIVVERFRSLGLENVLPAAMQSLADSLGGSLGEAGRMAYLLWKHPHLSMRIPRASVDQIQLILPDRLIETINDDEVPSWRRAMGDFGANDVPNSVTVHAIAL